MSLAENTRDLMALGSSTSGEVTELDLSWLSQEKAIEGIWHILSQPCFTYEKFLVDEATRQAILEKEAVIQSALTAAIKDKAVPELPYALINGLISMIRCPDHADVVVEIELSELSVRLLKGLKQTRQLDEKIMHQQLSIDTRFALLSHSLWSHESTAFLQDLFGSLPKKSQEVFLLRELKREFATQPLASSKIHQLFTLGTLNLGPGFKVPSWTDLSSQSQEALRIIAPEDFIIKALLAKWTQERVSAQAKLNHAPTTGMFTPYRAVSRLEAREEATSHQTEVLSFEKKDSWPHPKKPEITITSKEVANLHGRHFVIQTLTHRNGQALTIKYNEGELVEVMTYNAAGQLTRKVECIPDDPERLKMTCYSPTDSETGQPSVSIGLKAAFFKQVPSVPAKPYQRPESRGWRRV